VKVAIVGFAASRAKAPYANPTWDIWTMNDAWTWIKRADRWFEVHSKWLYEWVGRRPSAHVRKLSRFEGPVYMLYPDERIPNAIQYPLESVIETIGRPYLTSSIAYMIALAIHEGAEEIGIWGVDMATGSEYEHQRPCTEWLLGVAAGRGIKVTLPEGCSLLSGYLYGQGRLNPEGEKLTPEQIERRIAALEAELDRAGGIVERAFTDKEQAKGQVAEIRYWLDHAPDGLSTPMFNSRLDEADTRRDQADVRLRAARDYYDRLDGAVAEAHFWKQATPYGPMTTNQDAHAMTPDGFGSAITAWRGESEHPTNYNGVEPRVVQPSERYAPSAAER
jgi:hypothetical protein